MYTQTTGHKKAKIEVAVCKPVGGWRLMARHDFWYSSVMDRFFFGIFFVVFFPTQSLGKGGGGVCGVVLCALVVANKRSSLASIRVSKVPSQCGC